MKCAKCGFEAGIPDAVFKVGDRVRVIDCPESRKWYSGDTIGKEFTITEEDMIEYREGKSFYFGSNRYMTNFTEEMLQIIPTPVISEYDTIKREIEALDNGWDSRVSDLFYKLKNRFAVQITYHNDNSGRIFIGENSYMLFHKENYLFECGFDPLYTIIHAIQKMLLWLLDHSSIPKAEAIKVGDFIKRVNGDFDIEKVFKIDVSNYYYTDKSSNGCYTRDYIRLATPDEIRQHLLEQESTRRQNALILLEEKAECLRLELEAVRCEIGGLKNG
jgi:hypothetical protein